MVHDVEHPPARGDHGGEAGHLLMKSSPARAAAPLQMTRRRNELVVTHGIVLRVIEMLGPFIRVGVQRFLQLLPSD